MSDYKKGGFDPHRYIVKKADGTSIRSSSRYMVLNYMHDPHAREAMRTYSDSVEKENLELSLDIKKLLIETEVEFMENMENVGKN